MRAFASQTKLIHKPRKQRIRIIHLRRGNPKHPPTIPPKPPVTFGIRRLVFCTAMKWPINFDHEPLRHHGEIHNQAVNRMLPPDDDSVGAELAKHCPSVSLRQRGFAPQPSRADGILILSHFGNKT